MFALFLQEIWKILLYSLLLGAGLPVVYALGVRASALGTVPEGSQQTEGSGEGSGRRLVGRTLAGVCFAVVLAGVAVALAYIVAVGHGEQLSFQHVYPTFVPKS